MYESFKYHIFSILRNRCVNFFAVVVVVNPAEIDRCCSVRSKQDLRVKSKVLVSKYSFCSEERLRRKLEKLIG